MGLRSLICFALVGSGIWYWTKVDRLSQAQSNDAFLVWNGERPCGKTWAQLGSAGSFTIEPNAGIRPNASGLQIRMTGEGNRHCGLNWKGWYPDDACDDASSYNALTFQIRQLSHHAQADLTVELIDNVQRGQGVPASNSISILAEGKVKKIDAEWRKVVIPLERFTQNRPLRLDRLWGINFANQGNLALVFQIDQIGFVVEKAPPVKFPESPSYKATARLVPKETGYPISPGIYGVSDLPKEDRAKYGLPITRYGGNTTSRYNWKNNADNGAKDWFFLNRGNTIRDPKNNAYVKLIQESKSYGGTAYITLPMLGWVAKDNHSYSFPVSQLGEQQAVEPHNRDAGNGVSRSGQPLKADPRSTSIEASPEFISEAVQTVVQQAGTASQGGVQYWVLDNEPMLWHETHRDVRAKPLGYDELWERTELYATAIKRADPTAKVAGFCSWGWTDLFYSAMDEGGNQYASQPDHRAHGRMPLAEWFVKKCGDYQRKNRTPLVDVFDLHWYPQCEVKGKTPYLGKGRDLALNELRMRSTRDLWDPNYRQESWCSRAGDQCPTQILKRAREWVRQHNPSMLVSLGEYNFGGADNITGALAQADTFGILARERADMAFLWSRPEGTQVSAFDLYRNYDGQGGRFGDWFLPAQWDNANLGIYPARRTKDGATTIVLINKNLGGSCDLEMDLGSLKGTMRAWRIDQDTESKVEEMKDLKAPINGTLKLQLPAASATLVVIE